MSNQLCLSDLRIAVIGCGNWGKNLIRVYHQLGHLGAICDTDIARASLFREQYQIASLPFEEILSLPTLHAVAIATPSPTHFDLVKRALQAKKHVFVEKPLALELIQAKILAQVAQENQVFLMVGHLLQYHTAFRTLKKLIEEGAIGELHCVYANRTNYGKYRTEENVVWDFAPHDLSMILSLFQEMPQQVMACGANHFLHTLLDTASLHLQFSGKKQAHIHVSWLYPYKSQKLIAIGSRGIVLFDDCQPWEKKLQLAVHPNGWTDGLPHPFPTQLENFPIEKQEPLKEECFHFLKCIAQNTPPDTDVSEGIQVMTVLEAAMQAINEGMPVRLAPPTPSILKMKGASVPYEN